MGFKRCPHTMVAATPPDYGVVNNIQPQTRKERLSQQNREGLEKMRLKARREGYCSYEENGVTPPPDSLGYISEADRFITDVAAVQKVERDAEIAKKETILHNKRSMRADREEKRWRTIEMEHQMEVQRQEEMRMDSAYSRSNKTSMPYNPINLEYGEGRDGDCLRFSDEALKYRGALRADHLQRRMNNGYNPITGEVASRVAVPNRPNPPGGYM